MWTRVMNWINALEFERVFAFCYSKELMLWYSIDLRSCIVHELRLLRDGEVRDDRKVGLIQLLDAASQGA